MQSNSFDASIWQTILEHMEEAVAVYDRNGGLVYWNSVFKELYAYTNDDLFIGIHFSDLGKIDIEKGNVAIGDDFGGGEAYLARKAEYRKHLQGSFIVHLKDGRWIKTTDRRLPDGGFVSVQTDITELRQLHSNLIEKNDRLAQVNTDLRVALDTDFLTGTLSREAIIKQVQAAFSRKTRDLGEAYAVLFDLDYFKAINDNYGHLVGDRILKKTGDIARKFSSSLPHFGRMGGDEFLGLVTLGNDETPISFFEMFKSEFAKACIDSDINIVSHRVGLSAGFAKIDHNINDFNVLYQKLDEALYQAKASGRYTAIVY